MTLTAYHLAMCASLCSLLSACITFRVFLSTKGHSVNFLCVGLAFFHRHNHITFCIG